jgi:hypothetical protein
MTDESQTPLWQQALAGFINYQAKSGITKAIDWLGSLSEEECKEMSTGMSPDYAARFYAIVRAAKPTT